MHSRRRLVTVAVLACMTLTGLAGATPASAAPVPDPCKVLKVGQISKVFGSAVDAGVRAAREISSSSCSYSVPAGTDTPAGELIVTVTFSNAKTTYASLRRDQRFSPLTQDGFKGLYAPSPLGVVQVLRKSTMLSIQGVFFDAATYADVEVKEQLVALAKVALMVAMAPGIADAKTLSEKQWRKQANNICEQFHEDRYAILPESGFAITTLDEAQPYVDQAVPLYEGLITAIDSLAEPRSKTKGVKKFVKGVKVGVRTIEETPLAAFSAFEDHFAAANEAATKLRLRSCIRLANQRI